VRMASYDTARVIELHGRLYAQVLAGLKYAAPDAATFSGTALP
jgi:hypothetical protein